ncbi:MAG: glycoside hydrolase family 31 protein [Vicinamibacterales bacterium]
MPWRPTRREALAHLGAGGAGLVLASGVLRGQDAPIVVGGRPVEIDVSAVSARTIRLTVRPLENGVPADVPFTGALRPESGEFGPALRQARTAAAFTAVTPDAGLRVRFTAGPPTLHVESAEGRPVQRLTLSADAPDVSFLLPRGPLLGLGEGGAQFDRKGHTDRMRNGQVNADADGYRLATHGTRAPVQWFVGTDGWALFIHQPYGSVDLTGAEGRFTPREGGATAAPLDVFVVRSDDPVEIMGEYAAITGLPEMPARWTLGYLQSSRTLAGPDEILGVARTFREKQLPCDGLIYLGTEFAPSGWNTRNGEFTWHPTNFPDPKAMLDQLHAGHFKVIVHIVVEGRRLTGTVDDPCTAAPLPPGRTEDDRWPPERQVACYWPAHEPLMDVGVDGWWPDQGDGFDGPSRFNRHRMYWEGTQRHRPGVRPFALHRNASPGIQRYGGFIWSGDVQSRWDTLALHVPNAINTSLSGLPFWGTDIGGFNPTPEYTAELHVRWFQFGTFNPLFRSHGRNWHLRLPWGWDGGDGGPPEQRGWEADPAELHRPEVETILRKYLNLRYQLLPYTYTVVREAHDTGLPIIRALWLHYPDDAAAVARGDLFLWGRDLLVAPVTEPGATARRVYLPRGRWIDYWTHEAHEGGREIVRAVDLETMPLFVRAGTVLPMDPVRQYTDEPVAEPGTLVVYPGADGASRLYEDDGRSFAYRDGARMTVRFAWNDARRRLSLSLAEGSRMYGASPRTWRVRVAGESAARTVAFDGRPVSVDL